MKKRRIVKYDPKKHGSQADRDRVRHLTGEDIPAAVASDLDAPPPLDAEWFRNARMAPHVPKVPLSIRLDEDVLQWFKRQGPRYQSRINAVLRAFVDAHRGEAKP